MKLLKKVKIFGQIAKYCIKHRMPYIKTFRRLNEIHQSEGCSFPFLIQTDYLNNPKADTFYLPNPYFEKCLQLNPEAACDLLDNKTTLYKRCPQLLGRDCLILAECSEEEKLNFIRTHARLVGKRNYGSFAKQFSAYDTEKQSVEEILQGIAENRQVLLEAYIVQHEDVAKIYPHAVNTLRIHTVNNGMEIRSFLKPKLRIGCDNSPVDANAQTGSYRAILNCDGTVDMAAYITGEGYVRKASVHHNTNVSFEQVKIPYVQEAINLAMEAAAYFPELAYIGWDVAITPEGPVLVEGNSISGCLNMYQVIHYLYHGTGLKKEIEEMLDFGIKEKELEEV